MHVVLGFPLFPAPELDENIGNGTAEWIRKRSADRTPPSGPRTLKLPSILGVRPAADLFRGGSRGTVLFPAHCSRVYDTQDGFPAPHIVLRYGD